MGKHKKPEKIETDELCNKGCGNQAKYQTVSGLLLCESSTNSCPAMKAKNSLGLTRSYQDGRTKSDFGGKRNWAKGLTAVTDNRIKSNVKYDKDNFWIIGNRGPHKKLLIIERGHQCEMCRNTEWLNKQITLELDHINGNNKDNRKENLRLLCPNCHSTTPTWRRKKTKKHLQKNTDQEIIKAIQTSKTMYGALTILNLGWASKGTIEKIIMKYEINFMRP